MDCTIIVICIVVYTNILFTLPINLCIVLCTDCKDLVSVATLERVMNKNDQHYLRKAMKKVLKNKKQDPCMLMKDLYVNTYVHVAHILECNEMHSKDMVRAARTAIKLGCAKGDAKALTTTLTVAELLEELCISIKWDDTYLLERMVGCLPEEAGTLAMSLLNRYELYLDVYDDVVTLQDSLKKVEAAPKGAQIPVEVTVAKDLSEFTRKDCKEMLDLLLRQSLKIPHNKIMIAGAWSGNSTTVVFITDKVLTQSVIQYSVERNTLWAYQELSVTRIRIGTFDLNVSQLLTQCFKHVLRSGLTGDMDLVGATKVCYSCKLLVLLFAS